MVKKATQKRFNFCQLPSIPEGGRRQVAGPAHRGYIEVPPQFDLYDMKPLSEKTPEDSVRHPIAGTGIIDCPCRLEEPAHTDVGTEGLCTY